jgi:hypothetical protein
MEVCWVISVSGVVAFFFSNLPEVVSFICKRQCVSIILSLFFACAQYQLLAELSNPHVQSELGLLLGEMS